MLQSISVGGITDATIISLKHDSVYGIFNSIPDPLMIEVIAASGYDFVVIDTEHVAINDETLAFNSCS